MLPSFKNNFGWIGPLVAACLILAPVVRFCTLAETQESSRQVESTRSADTQVADASNATVRLPGRLARWCELPGCKAGDAKAAADARQERSGESCAGTLVATASASRSQRHGELAFVAHSAVAMRWHSKPPALPTRLQI
jgi:hypothetical protein